MKNFNFWRSLFFAALAVVGFAACSDDDNNGGGDSEASITVDGKSAVTIGVDAAAGETEAVEVVASGAWTLAFESEQAWLLPSVTSGKAGTTSLTFTVEALPEGIEERSATAVLSVPGVIFGVAYTVDAKVTVRQSPSGSAMPDTNVAGIRALLAAMNPTSTQTDVTEEIAAKTLTGIVVSNPEGKNTGSTWNISVQDGVAAKNSGLVISSSKFASNTYAPGTCVTVALTGAKVQLYNGLLQLSIADAAVDAIKTVSGEAPEPIAIVPDELLDYESMLVKIENCYPTAGYGAGWNTSANKGNVNFITTTGQAFICRTGSSAVFKDSVIPENMGTLTGIAGRYNNDKQLSPRTLADFKLDAAIPEPEYTKATIAELKAGNYEVEATLLAVYSKGLLLGDGTGYTLVFNNAWDTQTSNPYQGDLNKKITVKGQVSEYNGLLQFTAPKAANIIVGAANPDYALPQPTVFDEAGLTAYIGASSKSYEYVSLTGVLTVTEGTSNGNKYNSYTVTVPGFLARTITLAYGLDSYFTAAGVVDGDVVDVKGFALGYDTSKINIMVREVAKNTTTTALMFTSEPAVFAGNDPQEQTLSFAVKNLSVGALIDFSFEGADLDKFAVVSQTDASVTIKAAGNNDSGAAYNATLVAKIGNDKLAEVAVSQDRAVAATDKVLSVTFQTQTQLSDAGIGIGNDNKFTGEKSITVNGYTYVLNAKTSGYGILVSGDVYALFIGKQGSYIEFPAIENVKLVSVEIICGTNMANANKLNITDTSGASGADAKYYSTDFVSSNDTKGTTHKFDCTGTAANTAYRLIMLADKNLQINGWKLTYSE